MQGMSMSSILQSPTSSGWPLIVFAAQRGMLTAVRALLELCADVDSKEPTSGWTALMYAVTAGNQAMVRDLLAHGASPNEFARPPDWNPLAVAIVHNQESIMGMLLDAGALPTLIKKRHQNLLETYAGALQQYQAKCEAEQWRAPFNLPSFKRFLALAFCKLALAFPWGIIRFGER